MTGIKKIISDRFWNVLQEIDNLDSDCPLELFKERFDELDDETVFEVVTFLKKFEYPITIKKKAGMPWITITGERKPVMLEMTFSNWIALQAHVPFVRDLEETSFQNNLKECLQEVESRYPHYDLSRAIESKSKLSIVPFPKQEILNKLNRANASSEVILISLKDKKYECYPHKVIYIDSVLTFIGEETGDRCLVSFSFDEIEDIHDNRDRDYHANFSSTEVEDFIYGIRTITGNEERLVLKVTAPEKVDLKPDYQFLGNPYMTTNVDGDFIWAASVEVSDELFAWLHTICGHVEILDPEDIKKQFLDYLEGQESKKAA